MLGIATLKLSFVFFSMAIQFLPSLLTFYQTISSRRFEMKFVNGCILCIASLNYLSYKTSTSESLGKISSYYEEECLS